MRVDQAKKFFDAIDAAEIKSYQFDTDLTTHLIHDGFHNFVKFVEADEMVYGVSRANVGTHNQYQANVAVIGAWTEDIHEAKVAGNYQQIKTFMEAVGATLTDAEVKLIMDIDDKNRALNLAPDYTGFHRLTQAEIALLSDEEKEQYEKDLEAYEEARKNYMPEGAAASIRF